MKAVVTVRPIPHYNMVRFCNFDKCLQQLLTLIKCCVPGPVVWPVQPLHLLDTPMREVLSLHWLILWVGNVRLGRLSHRPKAHRASRVGIWARVWPQSQCFWQFLQKLSFFSVLREKVGPQTSTVPSSVSSKKKKKGKQERKIRLHGDAGSIPGREDPLQKAMAIPYSSFLAWEISWTRGAWWATVHGVAKESDMTLRPNNKTYHSVTPLQRTRRKVSKQPSPFAILKADQILSTPYPYKTTTRWGRKARAESRRRKSQTRAQSPQVKPIWTWKSTRP